MWTDRAQSPMLRLQSLQLGPGADIFHWVGRTGVDAVLEEGFRGSQITLEKPQGARIVISLTGPLRLGLSPDGRDPVKVGLFRG